MAYGLVPDIKMEGTFLFISAEILKVFVYFAGFNSKTENYVQKTNRACQRWQGVVEQKSFRTMCFMMVLGLRRMP